MFAKWFGAFITIFRSKLPQNIITSILLQPLFMVTKALLLLKNRKYFSSSHICPFLVEFQLCCHLNPYDFNLKSYMNNDKEIPPGFHFSHPQLEVSSIV